MNDLTFIIGGARSGKSAYAEQLAAQADGRVLYVATAQALDDEMHGAYRGASRPPSLGLANS